MVHRFDPAQAFMDAGHPPPRHHGQRGRGPLYREGARFGPGVPSGSRQMTEGELAPLRSRAAERRAAHQNAIARVQERYGDVLLVKAAELASLGVVTIATTAGTVEARIVRFWRGDSVLEVKVHIPFSRQPEVAKTLLTGGHVTEAPVLAGYLTRSVADLGPNVEVQDGPAT